MRKSKLAKTSEDGVDRISNLPDPIIHLILSRLESTEEEIRTSMLSTRWRHLWTAVPSIDIDYSRGLKASKKFKKHKFKEFVYRVLVNKPHNLESFRLYCGSHYNMSTVGWWIGVAVRRNVKQLDLMFGPHEVWDEDTYDIELPRCLMTCISLEVLRLALCVHGLTLPNFTSLLALRVLKLETCSLFDDNLVRGFLESCPLLEDLTLVNCVTHDLDCFYISCPELKELRIDNEKIDEDWVSGYGGMCSRLTICCPKLVYLELVGHVAQQHFIFESLDSLKKAVIHPEEDDYDSEDDELEVNGRQVCELLSGISHVESLSFHLCFTNKSINLEDLPKSLPNLKTLELNMTSDVFNMNVLIQILTCSPNIESLHLIIKEDFSCSSNPTQVPDVDLPFDHIFERIKMVKMTDGMTGALHEMEFIKFLLGSSPVLETMIISPSMDITDDDEKFESLTDNVLKFPQASPNVGIIFDKD